ncbi:polymer-forming cytoskeletal protein [Butyrivibrio sp. YAB3001]|uniref:polymer-forming cytoskeletal protein n=1 Tax=Butyrivibrio sp. YAB3001 TaxID=1520812 RepID=UPI0008F670DE|nr:polymer-forming cytoskeletal protein [Butyrivibrio sp. YAB3001]SFC93042.1 Polymer-forming protein [Butyrivibrio sp. YAB3001]
MGFFSELKNDLSQAVNTLMPDDKADDAAVLDSNKSSEGTNARSSKVKDDVDIDSMLSRLDDIKLDELANEDVDEDNEIKQDESVFGEESDFEDVESEFVKEEAPTFVEKEPKESSKAEKEVQKSAIEFIAEMKKNAAEAAELESLEEKIEEQTQTEVKQEQPQSAIEAISAAAKERYVATTTTEQYVATTTTNEQYATVETVPVDNKTNNGGINTMDFEQQTPTDETASITEGMAISGDIQTTGSLDLIGRVAGNIKCLGKLNITGEIIGDSDAAEIYAESARITGEIKSKGSVKVGQSTVIVGNIYGSSAVIAGAVKGDIDVHGPVVLDTTAIVMGNIKSQSVQINNGAVIEGMCSQAYADVNPSEFFETLKNR